MQQFCVLSETVLFCLPFGPRGAKKLQNESVKQALHEKNFPGVT